MLSPWAGGRSSNFSRFPTLPPALAPAMKQVSDPNTHEPQLPTLLRARSRYRKICAPNRHPPDAHTGLLTMHDLLSQGGRQQLGQAIRMCGVELRGRTLIYLWSVSRPDKTCDHCPKQGVRPHSSPCLCVGSTSGPISTTKQSPLAKVSDACPGRLSRVAGPSYPITPARQKDNGWTWK